MTSLLASGKYTYEAALEIIEELSRKYRCKTSAIGLGFLIKSITKEFRNTIKLALGDQKEAERVIKSALEQNQLISLIQHGFALQRVVNDEGLSKCKNRLVSQIALRKFVDHLNRYFEIKIPGDVFFPSFIKKSDGKICLQITGFDTLLDAFNPNSEEYRVYEELNSLIRRALMDAKIREVCIDRLNPEEIVGKLNKMHFAIYHKLLKEGKFEFSEVFIDGSIDFYLETLNSYGDITKNYIKNKLKSHVVVPFTDHQHWHIPIEGFRDIFKAKDAELREEYERFRKKYYGKTVKNKNGILKM